MFDRRSLRALGISVADQAQRRPIAGKLWDATAIHGDRIFAARAERPGIWDISEQPRLVTAKYPAAYGPPITILGDDVLLPDYRGDSEPRILAQPRGGGPDRVLAYAPGAENQPDLQSSFAVNPTTGEIIYSAAVGHDTNIDLLTLTGHQRTAGIAGVRAPDAIQVHGHG